MGIENRKYEGDADRFIKAFLRKRSEEAGDRIMVITDAVFDILDREFSRERTHKMTFPDRSRDGLWQHVEYILLGMPRITNLRMGEISDKDRFAKDLIVPLTPKEEAKRRTVMNLFLRHFIIRAETQSGYTVLATKAPTRRRGAQSWLIQVIKREKEVSNGAS